MTPHGLPRLVMALTFFALMVVLLSMYAEPPAMDTAAVEQGAPAPDAEVPAPEDDGMGPLATLIGRPAPPRAAEAPLEIFASGD